jgi:hypothetical protein
MGGLGGLLPGGGGLPPGGFPGLPGGGGAGGNPLGLPPGFDKFMKK